MGVESVLIAFYATTVEYGFIRSLALLSPLGVAKGYVRRRNHYVQPLPQYIIYYKLELINYRVFIY